ncbi:MAG TPA: hypothetical protein VGG12_07485 [Methylovirgula sp.]|jgi:hypothetical protein
MILGLSISAFTTLHVILSLIGIATGFIVLFGMLGGRYLSGWNGLFLLTTILTSATGFLFPGPSLDPARIVGIISLVALAIALIALYGGHLTGLWRAIYVVTAVLALYLNTFVGVVQAFGKIDFLRQLAPTQTEPPFMIAQGAVLLIFVVLGFLALRRFDPGPMAA